MLTAIDQIANRNHLQLFKAAIPYLPGNRQRFLSCYIKMLEFQNVVRFYPDASPQLRSCSSEEGNVPLSDMLSEMKNYCDENEKRWLDQFSNVLTAMELYSAMSENSEGEDAYE